MTIIDARPPRPTTRPTWTGDTTITDIKSGKTRVRYAGCIIDADLNRLAECDHNHRTRESAQSCADKMFVQKYNLKLPFER